MNGSKKTPFLYFCECFNEQVDCVDKLSQSGITSNYRENVVILIGISYCEQYECIGFEWHPFTDFIF